MLASHCITANTLLTLQHILFPASITVMVACTDALDGTCCKTCIKLG